MSLVPCMMVTNQFATGQVYVGPVHFDFPVILRASFSFV